MIEAIFIQSFDKEIKNSKLQDLINRIFLNLSDKKKQVLVFLNLESISLSQSLNIPDGLKLNFIFVDEQNVRNPTTRIFHFMMNYKLEQYKKILVLESDCFLSKNFDLILNQDLKKIKKNWFIYGSQYYGTMPWINLEENAELKKHMNGVAIYNRNKEFINLINYIFILNSLEEDEQNYDFAFYIRSLQFELKDRYIDSQYILNISDKHDEGLIHDNIKPEAVIVHTKNPTYYK